jgi:hypothetical protein
MPDDTHAAVDIASKNNGGQLWSEVISRKQKRPASLQQSIVAAVYGDQATKKRREKSLIVTGMEPSSSKSDTQLFSEMCDTNLHILPNIISTKRPGRQIDGKIQPLMVVLSGAEQARQLIDSAKLLPRSSDETISKHVHINPYFTRAEATAAYQVRQAKTRRLKSVDSHASNVGGNNASTIFQVSCDEADASKAAGQTVNGMQFPLNPSANPFAPLVLGSSGDAE